MQTSMVKSKPQKAAAILIGAMLLGFLWRVRGTHGWGSSWGLLNAGFVFTMFLTFLLGNRKKLDIGWISVTSVSFMLTVPGWGTLLKQISGLLTQNTSATGETTYEISQFSGIFIMLCLGFGMATLFGIMLGRGFSSKQWKIWDFVILIAVFYAFNYLAKATLAHWIVGLVQPQAAQAFEDGLVAAGKDGTAYEMFMKHFDNASWAKKIDGGRNYFAEIQAVASTISAIAVITATRFIIKDKRAARMGLIVSAAFAFSVTVSDIFFYLSAGGYHMLKESMLPECVHAWSFWEYFTGFFAGGIITAVVINLKPENDVEELVMKKVPEKVTNIIAILLGYVFAVGVNIARPIFTRYDDDYPVYYLIAGIVGAVIIAVLVILLLKKKFGLDYKKIDMQKFSALMLPFFIVSIFVTYMFIGTRDMWNILELFGGEAIAYWMIFNFVVLSVYTFIKTKQFKELKK